jgi:predicted metal-binding membrane protein
VAVLPILLISAACWLWIVVLARDMYGPMTGASAWMMTPAWDGWHLLLLWTMWAVMMAGMMLPSATPTLALYAGAARRNGEAGSRSRVYALAAGYVSAWGAFSLLATGLQRLLAAWLLVTPMMESATPALGATLLLIAGLYQLTPLKRVCLQGCQSPLSFLMRKRRHGMSGAFWTGAEHGAYCVGCCWALMLLLFAGGVMNLAVIAALTAFVAFEKITPIGLQGARVSGALLIGTAVWMFVR